MSWSRRLLNMFRSERLSTDIEREMSFHVAERTDALMEQGLTRKAAEREARRRFGNDVALRERTRETNLLGWLETLAGDVRYALRTMRAAPLFSLVAILSLGLGIGANTAIFSLMNSLMLKVLPVHAPEELVQVRIGEEGTSITNPIWEAVRDRQEIFSGVFAYGGARFNLAERGEERAVAGNYVSGGYFPTLGVRPLAGRLLGPADDVRGCAGAAVLGHDLWRSEYGSAASAVGSTISLNGQRFPIVGVADPSFFGMEVGSAVQVYLPLCAEARLNPERSLLDRRTTWWLTVVGRPLPGMTQERMEAGLATLAPGVFASTIPDQYPVAEQEEYSRSTLSIDPIGTGVSDLRSTYSRALMVLMVMVAVVLLVACANVANLLLARATSRQREMAVRMAIGASRARVIRQLLTESLLLSLVGAVLGVLFARWGTSLLVGLLTIRSNEVFLDLTPDTRVLLFTAAVATVTGVLFGLAPAWSSAHVQPQAAMKAHSRSVIEGHSRFSLGRMLVSAQLALSLVLVMGAALLLSSFRTLSTMDAGFRRSGVLIADVNMRNAGIGEEAQYATYRDLLERTRTLPGVTAASVASVIPVSGTSWNDFFIVEGFEPSTDQEALSWMNEVSEGYFESLGTPLLAGRDFAGTDRPGTPKVAIVNEAFATHYFGTPNVVGRQFRTQLRDEPSPPYEIIGVVANARYRSLREENERLAYVALNQNETPGNALSLILSTNGNATDLIPGFKAMISDAVPSAGLRFTSFEQQLAQSIGRERLLALLSAFFGGLALLLAMIGLYGIVSYSVARRRPEIGIRLAMGSERGRVMRLVLGEVGWMIVAGVAAGIAGVLVATRFMSSLLFGMSATDGTMLLFSVVVLSVVALLAGSIPAWRASRLDPMEALRQD